MNAPLPQSIEALLFAHAEPVELRSLAQTLSVDISAVREAVTELKDDLSSRGIRLVHHDDKVSLATAPGVADIITSWQEEDLSRDIGKAGLETLTIILYNAPISRSEIDYIRGVNSTYILRHLLVRGLIERNTNPKDKRSYIYKPTFKLLEYLGLENITQLPEYEKLQKELELFVQTEDDEEV